MAPETAIIAQQSTHEISPNIPHSNEVTTIQVGLAIIPVAFVLTLAFVFIKQVKYQKNLHTQLVNLKHFSYIPCRNCQFFDNNNYLTCAVQPVIVMSSEAIDCSDYAPKNR